MDDTYISFYLKANRIHVFINALRGIGSPKRICFMMDESGNTLILSPYDKRDFKSHAVPNKVYNGSESLEISSYKLCRLLASSHDWDLSQSYRIPGRIISSLKIVVFQLDKGRKIMSG